MVWQQVYPNANQLSSYVNQMPPSVNPMPPNVNQMSSDLQQSCQLCTKYFIMAQMSSNVNQMLPSDNRMLTNVNQMDQNVNQMFSYRHKWCIQWSGTPKLCVKSVPSILDCLQQRVFWVSTGVTMCLYDFGISPYRCHLLSVLQMIAGLCTHLWIHHYATSG